MAYNRKNLLKRIIAIQEMVIAGQKRGVSQKWIYENEVYPLYLLSFATFNNYLATNARLELQQLEKKEAEKKKQLSLKFN